MPTNSKATRTYRSKGRKYPWKEWFTSKKEIVLERGKDYRVSTPIMEQMIRNIACSRKYRLAVRMRINHKEGIIRFVVVGKLDEIPDKGTCTAPSRTSTFGKITIGTSFRFILSSGKVDYVNPVYTKIRVTGIQGKPYNSSYTYKARSSWRTRYVFVPDTQRVGVIEGDTK